MYHNRSPADVRPCKIFGQKLEKYDIVKFVCSATDARQIVKVVGEPYLLRRGAAVNEFIQKLPGNIGIHENEMNSGGYEANEAT